MSPFPLEKLHFCKNFPTIPSTLHLSLFLGYILEMIYPYVVIINVGLAKMSFQIKASKVIDEKHAIPLPLACEELSGKVLLWTRKIYTLALFRLAISAKCRLRGGGHNVSIVFVVNHHQTWHDGTLAQNLLKASLLVCMTSSSSFRYRLRSKFGILYLLSNLAEILSIGQF